MKGCDIHPNRYSKALLYILKLGLSAYIMWRIASKVSLENALKGFLALPLSLILLLICLTALRHTLQYFNWLNALRINPVFQENKKQVLVSYLIGLPLRFALPGGHAAIGKIFYIANSSKIASFWSTALERGFMTWACWSFAALATLFYYPEYSLLLRAGIFALCLLLPVILYFALGSRKGWRYLQSPYKRQAPKLMSLQIANTLITYLQYWLILNQFVPLSWWASSIRMSLTQFSNSIPITIAGLGLRESFAIHFLRSAGIGAMQAVSATLSLFIIQDVFPAVIGAVFLLKAKKASNYTHANCNTNTR